MLLIALLRPIVALTLIVPAPATPVARDYNGTDAAESEALVPAPPIAPADVQPAVPPEAYRLATAQRIGQRLQALHHPQAGGHAHQSQPLDERAAVAARGLRAHRLGRRQAHRGGDGAQRARHGDQQRQADRAPGIGLFQGVDEGLAALAQGALEQDPFSGHVFVFRGRRGDIVKLLWWDGQGLCLFAKRLERGRFVWPQAEGGTVHLSRAQLSMLLEGIDWRHPERTTKPLKAA